MPVEHEIESSTDVLMFDLTNGKTILCRVRPLTVDEEFELDEEELDHVVLAVNPRILSILPTGNGTATVVLIPYLNGRHATVYTGHIVASAAAPKIYCDQYAIDTDDIVAVRKYVHECPSCIS